MAVGVGTMAGGGIDIGGKQLTTNRKVIDVVQDNDGKT
jgi:hypothetical protein